MQALEKEKNRSILMKDNLIQVWQEKLEFCSSLEHLVAISNHNTSTVLTCSPPERPHYALISYPRNVGGPLMYADQHAHF
jgi:hypothetical protein